MNIDNVAKTSNADRRQQKCKHITIKVVIKHNTMKLRLIKKAMLYLFKRKPKKIQSGRANINIKKKG